MISASERVEYITEYLTSYERKIRALNKCGLYSEATLFELFALNVCQIWFGIEFKNLNTYNSSYPYVDLVSGNGEIFVQVGTNADMNSKVRQTLVKIRDSKNHQNITKLYFFLLGDDNHKVRDFTGENQIGKIDFKADENLITIHDIIEKVKVNEEFQIALHELLNYEYDNCLMVGSKLNEIISKSKSFFSIGIDDLINNEYEIDRNELIEQIKNENYQFISVQGEAGIGKSAFCKKLLKSDEIVLCVRAEEFINSNLLSDIWGINLVLLFKYMQRNKVIIYIDALEFIADSYKQKPELLYELYNIAQEYPNVYIVTSCRKCDSKAFIKIESTFKIKIYEILPLNSTQIVDIAKNYKVIQELLDKKTYVQLLASPFYVNILVKEIKNLDNINDVNSFRNYIWEYLICLSDKAHSYGVKSSDIRTAVNNIVIKRATNLVTGVSLSEVQEEIARILIRENVTAVVESNKIRLKFDIFEDICFERIIDECFENAKGNYKLFFDNIEKLGNCVYRRYQIWVENKLFSRADRKKFIYNLLKTNRVAPDWYKQTIIGIIKSDYCRNFFEENGDYVSTNRLDDFISLVNFYAYDIEVKNLNYGNHYTFLKPIGLGRKCLLHLISINALYKSEIYDESSIARLCIDYSKYNSYDQETTNDVCNILEFYIEKHFNNLVIEYCCYDVDTINQMLQAVYVFADYSKGWLCKFWVQVQEEYIKNKYKLRWACEDIIEHALKNMNEKMAKFMPLELCELADTYWLKQPVSISKYPYKYSYNDYVIIYGLSKNADNVTYDFAKPQDNNFLYLLLHRSFRHALDWIINLTNHVAESYVRSNPQSTKSIRLLVDGERISKEFVFCEDFWLAGSVECQVPVLVGDALCLLKECIIDLGSNNSLDDNSLLNLLNYVKNEIYLNANNAMMLNVISEIGRSYAARFPGYALDLSSSIDIVMADNNRYVLMHRSSEVMLLERQIAMVMGLSEVPRRYVHCNESVLSIQSYMLLMQRLTDCVDVQGKAVKILKYMYDKYPNNEENAFLNLQVQKMDLSKTDMYKLDNDKIAVVTNVEGEAKKIVDENKNSPYIREQTEIYKIVTSCLQSCKESNDVTKYYDAIDKLIKFADDSQEFVVGQDVLIKLIATVLGKDNCSSDKRSELCDIWINGMYRVLNNGSFTFNDDLCPILFKQIEYDIDVPVRNRLRRLILDLIMYGGDHGRVCKYRNHLKKYLPKNHTIAKFIFNTIVAISIDEMNCYKYNVAKINSLGESIDYKPNVELPPINIKYYFAEKNIPLYESKIESLIEKYLFNEETVDYKAWDVSSSDICTLSYIANCGLNLEDCDFYLIMKQLFVQVTKALCFKSDSNLLNYREISEIEEVLKREIVDVAGYRKTISIMFDGIDFSRLRDKLVQIYKNVSGALLIAFFDSYNSDRDRQLYKNIVLEIEKKVEAIQNKTASIRLSSMLFLSLHESRFYNFNQFSTKYGYDDKMFLCNLWNKYGADNFSDMLSVIYQLHIKELLPEVIVPLDNCIKNMMDDNLTISSITKNDKYVLNIVLTMALVDFSDAIKKDLELSDAYQSVLNNLNKLGFEESGLLLDEFKIH